MPKTSHYTLLRRELEAVAGRPNWTESVRSDLLPKNMKACYWWVTEKVRVQTTFRCCS
jgi:hypothetical protein